MSIKSVLRKVTTPFCFCFSSALLRSSLGPDQGYFWRGVEVAVPKQGTKRDPQSGSESLSLAGDRVRTTSIKQKP